MRRPGIFEASKPCFEADLGGKIGIQANRNEREQLRFL